MKTQLLFLFFGGCSLFLHAEVLPTQLKLWGKDGSQQTFALARQPKVTFTETELVITGEALEVNVNLDGLLRMTYEKEDLTGLTDLVSGHPDFALNGTSVVFRHLGPNSRISLMDLNGVVKLERRLQQGGSYVLPLSGLPTGTYLLRVNGLTTKIIKP